MNIKNSDYQLNNLNYINIILGKNGSGKSTILQSMLNAKDDAEQSIYSEYITPERGGFLKQDPNIDASMNDNPRWLKDARKHNQFQKFKEQTINRYQRLEINVLQTLEQKLIDDSKKNEGGSVVVKDYPFFDKNVSAINSLLDNIEVRRVAGGSFEICKKGTTTPIPPDKISSGESELISLAIEFLYFQKSDSESKEKIILVDEPDVHLHPDLQVKFMRFLHLLVTDKDSKFRVVIATHSTAFLGALEDTNDVHVAFIKPNQKEINFRSVTDAYKKFLPVFGAHPLSNLFNEAPVLLVEGEDEERIWQQAVRSSVGAIKIYPCVCGDVNQIAPFEKEVKEVIESVYDNAKAYSLRDQDDTPEEDLEDDPPIIKHKLHCYSSENLLLTDEVINSLGYTWDTLKKKMDEWITEKEGKSHDQLEDMKAFQTGSYDRKNQKIKSLRMLLMGIMGSSKPWEVAVGQTISQLKWNDSTDFGKDGSIYNFLGEKLTKSILPT